MIEFALCMPVLVLLLFGAADFGRLFYVSIEVVNAAAAGALWGSLKPANMTNTAGIVAAAKNDAPDVPNLKVDSLQVCQNDQGQVTSCSSSSAYKYVQVTASTTYRPMLIFPPVTISKSVKMRGE